LIDRVQDVFEVLARVPTAASARDVVNYCRTKLLQVPSRKTTYRFQSPSPDTISEDTMLESRRLGAACTLLAALVGFLAGCASPYGRNTLFGGFSEEKLSDTSYRIAYSGNGYTNEDMVVKYWLHRCAELTLQAGYTYFGLVPGSDKAEKQDSGHPALARGRDGDTASMHRVKGGGAPIFIYVPGHTVRTYAKRGVIVMFHSRAGATTEQHALSLHAATVARMLKPYVDSQGKEEGPDRREVIDAAVRFGRTGDGI
jgi:hypothetical protein